MFNNIWPTGLAGWLLAAGLIVGGSTIAVLGSGLACTFGLILLLAGTLGADGPNKRLLAPQVRNRRWGALSILALAVTLCIPIFLFGMMLAVAVNSTPWAKTTFAGELAVSAYGFSFWKTLILSLFRVRRA